MEAALWLSAETEEPRRKIQVRLISPNGIRFHAVGLRMIELGGDNGPAGKGFIRYESSIRLRPLQSYL